ncbi:hypothetical protein BJF83_07580 [Nocardiopsis sp. CNR-923]|uniref:hypothetical protein n=1 Tax=Nocardiopsis sp. CNR-923 TaxID=1904965 RepID=UPI00095F55C7|nr:hypothetical protein [Nocardiopsis sp. CNR-923]OLT30584.1 hypothetical protein BJF83_07580 [Nocardiopsis sp. CNR-923]
MIPGHWRPHRRDEDGELLGYLVPDERERHVPVTLFGHPMGEPGDEHAARAVLDSHGLAYLADRWLLSVPDQDAPINVRIVEVSPRRMRVANDDVGYERVPLGHVFVLDVPEAGRLRRA